MSLHRGCVCVCSWVSNSCPSSGSQCCLCRISCFVRGFIFFQLSADTQQGHCLRLITKYTSSLCPAPQPALLNFFDSVPGGKGELRINLFYWLTFYCEDLYNWALFADTIFICILRMCCCFGLFGEAEPLSALLPQVEIHEISPDFCL